MAFVLTLHGFHSSTAYHKYPFRMLIMFHQHCRWAYSASPLRSFCPLSELFFLFRTVFLYHQIVYDEVLSLGRILAHVILQKLLHLVGLVESYLF